MGCERRRVGCHSGCADYREFREKLDAAHAARDAENVVNDYVIRVCTLYADKKRRKKGRK